MKLDHGLYSPIGYSGEYLKADAAISIKIGRNAVAWIELRCDLNKELFSSRYYYFAFYANLLGKRLEFRNNLNLSMLIEWVMDLIKEPVSSFSFLC